MARANRRSCRSCTAFYVPDEGSINVFGEPLEFNSSQKGDRSRHRHGPPALHAGRTVFRAGEHHSWAPRAASCSAAPCRKAREGPVAALRTLWAERGPGRRRLERSPSACSSASRSSKRLYRGAKVLILDEPTGVLTPQEADALFDILRALKEQGNDHPAHHAQAARNHGRHRLASPSSAAARWLGHRETAADLARRAGRDSWLAAKVLLEVDKAPAQPKQVALSVTGSRPRLRRRTRHPAALQRMLSTCARARFWAWRGFPATARPTCLKSFPACTPPAAAAISVNGAALGHARPDLGPQPVHWPRPRRPATHGPGDGFSCLGVGHSGFSGLSALLQPGRYEDRLYQGQPWVR